MNGSHDVLPLTAAVLAGGRSSRMGSDKALLPLGGTPLLIRALGTVTEVCAHVMVVVADAGMLKSLDLPDGVEVVVDEVPGLGPSGALASALAAAEDEWVFVVAADMPFVHPDVIRMLWGMRSDVQAVVPRVPEGAEPLLALYSRECLHALREMLAAGRRRPVALLESATVRWVDADVLRTLDPDLLTLLNINTPDDLAAAERILATRLSPAGRGCATISDGPTDKEEAS